MAGRSTALSMTGLGRVLAACAALHLAWGQGTLRAGGRKLEAMQPSEYQADSIDMIKAQKDYFRAMTNNPYIANFMTGPVLWDNIGPWNMWENTFCQWYVAPSACINVAPGQVLPLTPPLPSPTPRPTPTTGTRR
jgi:hypothetical protein